MTVPPAPRTLNLGILAHVDAGKTTLTERLLHFAGVVDEPGSVDSGTTLTDSLAIERRRGITIKTAVVSFPLAGGTVNVVDTPGQAATSSRASARSLRSPAPTTHRAESRGRPRFRTCVRFYSLPLTREGDERGL